MNRFPEDLKKDIKRFCPLKKRHLLMSNTSYSEHSLRSVMGNVYGVSPVFARDIPTIKKNLKPFAERYKLKLEVSLQVLKRKVKVGKKIDKEFSEAIRFIAHKPYLKEFALNNNINPTTLQSLVYGINGIITKHLELFLLLVSTVIDKGKKELKTINLKSY